VAAIVAEAGAVSTVPAGQASFSMQLSAFVVELDVPSGQGEQLRSAVLFPARATNSPGPQSLHSSHASRFASSVYVPEKHEPQTRSPVVVPAIRP
jgi:hypothetical protein